MKTRRKGYIFGPRRLFAALITALVLLLAQVPLGLALAEGGDTGTSTALAATSDGAKAGEVLTVLAFSSDVHNDDQNNAANRLKTWLDNMEGKYGDIDVMAFGGDMGSARANGNTFWTYTQANMNVLDQRGLSAVYTTGNHEYMNGSYTNGANSTTQKYQEDTRVRDEDTYHMYCLGSASSNWNEYSRAQVTALDTYLGTISDSKPVFIITHYPLHWTSSRSITRAGDIINTLNSHADKGRKIVFLWGHNHTDANQASVESHYDEIFAPGESIQYAQGSNATLKFYYAAAGCMSDSEYGAGSGAVRGKGLIVTINSKNQLSFAYHNASGDNVTEDGTSGAGSAFTEQDPVAIDDVTITAAGATTIEAGKSVLLSFTTTPADATRKSVTWSSSNEAVAKVSASGRVRGVSAGTATITLTVSDGITRGTATDSINITVEPRSSADPNYVIVIGGQALSTETSPNTYSTSGSSWFGGGNTYKGMSGVPYSEGDEADDSIRWVITESDDGTGYYIQDLDGNYLKATYTSSGSTWQSTSESVLKLDDTPDVWKIDADSLDDWLLDGTMLSSTNASGRYLTYEEDASAQLFTVRSTGEEATLYEANDPTPVTGITISGESEVMARKSIQLTANVTPEGASKSVTWTSSDASVATVDANGKVKGVNPGTAIITATAVYGGVSATHQIRVTANPNTDPTYVIVIDGYALSANTTDDTLENAGSGSQRYYYHGLGGVAYKSGDAADDSIRWTITPANGGYYIMDSEGRYLNATYESNSTGGYTGTLKLDNTPDVWTLSGDTLDENGEVDGAKLKSANASAGASSDKFLALEDTAHHLFTVRSDSNADEISISLPEDPVAVTGVSVDPTTATVEAGKTTQLTATVTPSDATNKNVTWSSSNTSVATVDSTGKVTGVAEGTAAITATTVDGGKTATATITVTASTSTSTAYKLVDSLEDGGEYLIVSANAAGSGYALTNPGGTSGGATMGRTAVTVQSGDVDGDGQADLYVETEETSVVWAAATNGSGFNLSNDTDYLEGKSGNVAIFTPMQYADRYWTYTGSQLQHHGGQNTYTVYYSGSSFTSSYNSTSNTVYVYQKVESAGPVVPVAVTGVSVDPTTATVEAGKTTQLTATVTPSDATNKNVTWSSSNTSVATVDSTGKVTGVAEGTAAITATTVDGGKTATATITVTASTSTGTKYVLTDTLEAGKNYIIANKNTGEAYALTNNNGSVGKTSVEIVDDEIHTDNENIVFTTEGSGASVSAIANGGRYLSPSNRSLSLDSSAPSNRAWSYGTDSKLIAKGTNSTYYVYYSTYQDGNYSASTSETSTSSPREVYLFEEVMDAGCSHELTEHPETAATCTESGNSAYWSCSKCGKFFSDAEGKNEITEGSWIINALGHNLTEHPETAATCTAEGNTAYWSCDRCDKLFSDADGTIETTAEAVTIAKAAHTPATDAAVSPTCTTTGLTEGSHCSVCGEVLTAQEAVPALGHDLTKNEAKEATCTAEGNIAHWRCGRCGKLFSDADGTIETTAEAVTIAKAAHTPATDAAVAPTCTEDGLTEGSHCSVCGEVLTAQEAVPALGHDFGDWVVTKDPTCTETGIETRTCNRCGTAETRDTEALGHSWGTPAISVMPGCETEGVLTYTCTRCGSTNEEPVAPTGHKWNTPTYIWNKVDDEGNRAASGEYVSVTATRVCMNDETHFETENVNVDEEKTVTVAATDESDGSVTYYSKEFENEAFEAQELKVTIPATGHELDYDHVEWAWTGNDDEGWACEKAVVKCKNFGEDDYFIEPSTTLDVQTAAATCTKEGATTYTASFIAENGETYKDTKTVTIPMIDHTPGQAVTENVVPATCTEAGSHDEVTYCTVCNEKLSSEHIVDQKLDHNYTALVTNPTCTEKGYTTYTCTVCGDTYKADETEALGHDWGDPIYAWEDGNSKVIATRTCGRDGSHNETEIVSTTAKVTKKATCKDKGETTYTATFANDAFEQQSKTVADVAKLAHKMVFQGFTWTGSDAKGYTKAVANYKCSECGETKAVEATITKSKKSDATIYTAKVAKAKSPDGKDHSENKTVKDLANAKVTVASPQYYTGKALKPAPKVTFGGKTLKAGIDYTVAYKNNTKTGTATVTVTGKGAYVGTNKATFKIVDRWQRLAGDNAVGTMKAIVNADGVFTASTVDTVVVAGRRDFKAALAGTALAGLYKAPLLITDPNSSTLSGPARSELQRLKPSRVIVVGDTSVVPAAHYSAIKSAVPSAKVSRVSGSSASGTANAIAKAGGKSWGKTAVVATQAAFKDALSIAPYAYAKHAPIFFTESTKMSDGKGLSSATVAQIKAGGFTRVLIVGGELAVPKSVESQLKGIKCQRLAGANAIETCKLIGQFSLKEGMGRTHLAVATTQDFADALAGAALCGAQNSILVLANQTGGYGAFDSLCNSKELVHGHVLGGTFAISEASEAYFRKK